MLKPGAVFCIYDVMKGRNDGLKFPVPWAETAADQPPDDARGDAGAASAMRASRSRRSRTALQFALDFFRQSLANAAAGAPPLGLHIVMGASTREKFQNMLANIESGAIAPTLMIARRAA